MAVLLQAAGGRFKLSGNCRSPRFRSGLDWGGGRGREGRRLEEIKTASESVKESWG